MQRMMDWLDRIILGLIRKKIENITENKCLEIYGAKENFGKRKKR